MKKALIGTLFLLMLSGCSVASDNVKDIPLTDAKSTVSFFEKKLNDADLGVEFSSTDAVPGYYKPAAVWWISDDGKNTFIKNAFSTGAEISVPAFEMTPEQKAEFEKEVDLITDLMDEELSQNGFTKNAKTSSENFDDSKVYDYVLAYEKGPTVCTFTLNRDYYNLVSDESKWFTTLVFACSDEFKKYYAESLPYLNAVANSPDEHFAGDYAMTGIEKTYGDFTVADFSAGRSGFFSIFKKVDDKLQVLFSGQEDPSCKIVDKYKIPKEIVGRCWSDDGLTEREVK